MYYECCLITQLRNPHTVWHIYLFALYLFAFLLYAKPSCDRVVYSLALPSPRSNSEQIERGRRATDGQPSGGGGGGAGSGETRRRGAYVPPLLPMESNPKHIC